MKDKIMDFFKKNKIAVIIAAVALVAVIVGVVVALVSCNGSGKDDKKNNGPVEYTLNVQTEGGMPFEGVSVYVYEDKDIDNMIFAGKTDENGQYKFTTELDPDTFGYVLDGIPEEGYELKDMYSLTPSENEDNQLYLYVSIEIVALTDMDNTTFDAGSIIKDFTVTTPDGTEVTISELLGEKKAVVLNFFYLACQPCKNEFPYLEEAYKQYSDDVAVIAMTPVDNDDTAIQALIDELGLTFYMAQCPSQWEKMLGITAYPTTVVIDRWGMISFIHTGSVTESGVFESIFSYYTSSSYVQGVVKYLDDIINYEAEVGTQSNPLTILADSATTEVTVGAGKEMYCEIPKATNLIMTIKDSDIYVMYNEEKYEPVDGVITLDISAPDSYTPAQFIIGNTSSADKTVTVELNAVAGTMMNPYEAVTGDVATDIEAGNEQGVYYTYTATESGTLTYKAIGATNGVSYDITLYNLNSYINRTLAEDANADGTVSVVVNAGDVVQIIISTLPDENNEYPAATINIQISFVAGEGYEVNNAQTEYSVTVKDADGNAVSGVTVSIDTAEATTDASGVAKVTLKSGSYAVSVTCPDGYKMQGDVTVTADAPSATVILVSKNAKQVTYTIKVTDESGSAIKGATVIVGSSLATTNASGSATVTLAEGSYDVTVSASGYAAGSGKVTKSTTSVTIKLKKSTATTTGITYTVNVVDYKGTGQSDVTVIFKSNGTPVATATTNSSGKATASLEKGTYNITLAFASGNYGYESTNTKVTASSTTTTITVAKVAENTKTVNFDTTGAYYISTGGQYVEIPSADASNEGGNAYFLFEPTRAGTYKITVLNTSAKISYWGGNVYYGLNESTENITHTSTSITLNVKEAGPTYIVGVKGVSECIISVVRTGSAITDANDMEWTDYTATDTVKPYTFTGGTLTEVDITKSTDTYNLVYNSSDGYYHLGSTSGPVMLVKLGTGAPYIALSDVIGYTGSGGSNFGKFIYDSTGTLTKKENYTSLLMKYMENMDQTNYVYPLTKDLMYMLKNGGEQRGWWSSTGDNNVIYQEKPNLNSEIAWMFACCYVAE